VGLGNGTQNCSTCRTTTPTDFVLAVIAEELGLIGVSLLLALFAVLVVRDFLIASRTGDRSAPFSPRD
jgi:cell division protein FtsW (lipid II flippase)